MYALQCLTHFYKKPTFIPLHKNIKQFSYLGFIKNQSYYIDEHHRAYEKLPNGIMNHVAYWREKEKMLWIDSPITYELIPYKDQNYFYDIVHKDAYYYDKDMSLVIPAGFYDKKYNVFIEPFL